MKIALLSPYAPPERGACSIRVQSLYDFFKKKGAVAFIVSPQRGKVVAGHVKRYANFWKMAHILKRENPDILIGSSPPMTHSVLGLIIGKLLNKRLFLDLRDPWTYGARNLGIYAPYSPKLLFYQLLEKIGYWLSEKIFVVTTGIQSQIRREGASPKKIVLAPNGTLPNLFVSDQAARQKIRARFNISPTQPILIFSGEFLSLGLEKVIPIVAPILKKHHAFLLLLVPKDAREKKHAQSLEQICRKSGLQKNARVVDIRPLELPEIADFFSAADIGLSVMPPAWHYCIPAKVYDYAASGLYVLGFGPKKSCLAELITKNRMGSFASNAAELQATLEKALQKHLPTSAFRKKIRSIASSQFDRQKTARLIWKHISSKKN